MGHLINYRYLSNSGFGVYINTTGRALQHFNTMAMKSACVFLVTLVVARAQIPNIGWCPDYLPKSDFDMERFLGKWYEAERYFTISELVSRCVVTDYARAPSGKIYVSNEVTNRLTGVKRVIGGNLELVGKLGEGKLNVRYATTPLATETVLTVLDTDYDNYAVVWSCNGYGPIHTENAWVMTRERLPPGNVLQKAYGVLDKFRISRTFFVKTDQEGCALAASDINAANGITATSTVIQATGSDQKKGDDYRSSGLVDNALSGAEAGSSNEAQKEDSAEPQKAQPLPVAQHILNNVDNPSSSSSSAPPAEQPSSSPKAPENLESSSAPSN